MSQIVTDFLLMGHNHISFASEAKRLERSCVQLMKSKIGLFQTSFL